MKEYKVTLKIKSEGLTDDQAYYLLNELYNISDDHELGETVYIEIEDNDGEVLGFGEAGEGVDL